MEALALAFVNLLALLAVVSSMHPRVWHPPSARSEASFDHLIVAGHQRAGGGGGGGDFHTPKHQN